MIVEDLVTSLNPWWRDPGTRGARAYPVRREIQPRLLERLLDLADRRAFALAGPRQVGKTTILLQLVDDLLDGGWPAGNITFFDFSDARLTEEIVPSDVVEVRPATLQDDHPRVLLFDEIHLGLRWDRWLKNAVDRGGHRIGVTDSAASLLRTGGVESGQGRWDEYRIEGLGFREALSLSGEPADSPEQVLQRLPNMLERYLAIGGFPELIAEEDFRRIRRRIREDIAQRAIYRDLEQAGVDVDGVRRLFVFLAQESGEVFRLRPRAEQLQNDHRTVKRWLRLLDEAALVVRLPRFGVRASSRMRAPEKIYAADHGLVSAFAVTSASEERVRSRVFEAVVFRHLRDLTRERAREREGGLSFFRQRNDLEIDFVLELPERRVAVEVTSSGTVPERKIERLGRAADELGAEERFLVSGGVTEAVRDGVRVLPLREFLLRPERVLEREAD